MYNQDILIDIINELKKNFNSLNEFAKESGVNSGYISKILNKRTLNAPTPNILEKLSNTSILHKEDYYSRMMKACGYINNTLSNETITNAKEKSSSMLLDEKKQELLNYMNQNNIESLFAIPLYSNIESSLEESSIYLEGYIPVNPNIFKMKNPDDYFYLKMMDDSMNNKYEQGDYVLMKKTSTIKNDNICLLIQDNKLLIRKILLQGDLVLIQPLSSNAKYTMAASSKESIKILGIAVGYIGYERGN